MCSTFGGSSDGGLDGLRERMRSGTETENDVSEGEGGMENASDVTERQEASGSDVADFADEAEMEPNLW